MEERRRSRCAQLSFSAVVRVQSSEGSSSMSDSLATEGEPNERVKSVESGGDEGRNARLSIPHGWSS